MLRFDLIKNPSNKRCPRIGGAGNAEIIRNTPNPRFAGPTLADLAIFDNVMSPFPGLLALGVDMSPYPKMMKVVDAIKPLPFIAKHVYVKK